MTGMRIISRSKILEFCAKHPDAETALEEWYHKTRRSEWTCLADLKRSFGSADSAGDQHYVFNVKGNAYRLVAVIKFTIKTAFIRFIGAHGEYDKIDCSTI